MGPQIAFVPREVQAAPRISGTEDAAQEADKTKVTAHNNATARLARKLSRLSRFILRHPFLHRKPDHRKNAATQTGIGKMFFHHGVFSLNNHNSAFVWDVNTFCRSVENYDYSQT